MAAMATVGVVKHRGQLSRERERPSMCEVTWTTLTNAVILKKWCLFLPLGGAIGTGLEKNSL